MAAVDLLNNNPEPTEEEIRNGLEGVICRCTGYENIVRAVQYASEKMTSSEETEKSMLVTDAKEEG